ncbi:MAG: YybH family protein, partial [Alphaproteobacteria bacterium]
MTAKEAIVAAHEALNENLNSGNAAGIAQLFTEDASILPPNSPRIDGREGIQGYWQTAIDMGIRDGVVSSLEIEDFGDWATQIGGFTATVPGEDGQRA